MPVITVADGHSYERAAIKRWLKAGHRRSPISNLPLETTRTLPNHALRRAVALYLDSGLASDEERAEYLARRLALLRRDGAVGADDVLARPPFAPASPAGVPIGLSTLAAVISVLRGPWALEHPAVATAALAACDRVLEDCKERLCAPWHEAYAAMTGSPASADDAVPFGGGQDVQLLRPQPFTSFGGPGMERRREREQREGAAEAIVQRLQALQGLVPVFSAISRHASGDAAVAVAGARLATRLLRLHAGRSSGPLLPGFSLHVVGGGNDGRVAFSKQGCLLALITAVQALGRAHGRAAPTRAVDALVDAVIDEHQTPPAAFDALVACLCVDDTMPTSMLLDVLAALATFPSEAWQEQPRQAALAQPEAIKAFKRMLRKWALADHEDGKAMVRFLTPLVFLGRLAAAPYYRQAIGAKGRAQLIEALLDNLLEPAAQGGRVQPPLTSASTAPAPTTNGAVFGPPLAVAGRSTNGAVFGPPLAVAGGSTNLRPAASSGPAFVFGAPPVFGPIPIPPAGAATSSTITSANSSSSTTTSSSTSTSSSSTSSSSSSSNNPAPAAPSSTMITTASSIDDETTASSSAPTTTTAATVGWRGGALGRFTLWRLNPLRLLRLLRSEPSAASDSGAGSPQLAAATPTPATATTGPSLASALPPSTSSTATAVPTMGPSFLPPVALSSTTASASGIGDGFSMGQPPPPPMSFGFMPVTPATRELPLSRWRPSASEAGLLSPPSAPAALRPGVSAAAAPPGPDRDPLIGAHPRRLPDRGGPAGA